MTKTNTTTTKQAYETRKKLRQKAQHNLTRIAAKVALINRETQDKRELNQLFREIANACEREVAETRPRYSTEIGFVNSKQQKVIEKTDRDGTDHMQKVYILQCQRCYHEYGSNGSDNWQRKCPECQSGRPGI